MEVEDLLLVVAHVQQVGAVLEERARLLLAVEEAQLTLILEVEVELCRVQDSKQWSHQVIVRTVVI